MLVSQSLIASNKNGKKDHEMFMYWFSLCISWVSVIGGLILLYVVVFKLKNAPIGRVFFFLIGVLFVSRISSAFSYSMDLPHILSGNYNSTVGVVSDYDHESRLTPDIFKVGSTRFYGAIGKELEGKKLDVFYLPHSKMVIRYKEVQNQQT
jgi:hypothetical protein